MTGLVPSVGGRGSPASGDGRGGGGGPCRRRPKPCCSPAAPRPRGFTLVELIVALAIFALLATAGVAMLRSGADATAAASASQDETARLLRLRALLADDLGQAAARRVRDPGGALLPAFAGQRGDRADAPLFALTRRGWANDDALARASLQRVEWWLSADGRLQRRAAPMLDGAAFGPPATLMTGITGVAVRFRTRGAWSDRWDREAALPDAVELTLELRAGGRLTQAFLVGPG